MRFLSTALVLGLTVFTASQTLAASLYRSIGPGHTASLAAGGFTLAIAGNTATFGSALPANVGVGDVIQYDANNDSTPDALAFISGRTDDRHFTVQSAVGTNPVVTLVPDLNWSIYRAYTALSNAVSGTENTSILAGLRNFDTGNRNAVTNNEIWNFACYGDALDSTPVVWDNWTTDATHYIRIYTPYLPAEVGVSQRHTGTWTAGAYALEVSNASALTLHDDNIRVEGLQIAVDAVNAMGEKGIDMFTFAGTVDLRISHCLIRGAGNSNQDWHSGISEYNTINGTIRIWDNIIYDFTGSSSNDSGMELKGDPVSVYVYNNTVVNCYNGYWRNFNTNLNATVINNIAQNCILGFDTAFDPASDYNVSDIGDAPGIHSRNGSVSFVDAAGSDFHLTVSDTVAQNAGTDLSTDPILPFTDDIDSEIRSTPWDIGADEQPLPFSTATFTHTMTPTPTVTETPVLSPTRSATSTRTPTITISPTISPTPTHSPTITPSPSRTFSPTVSPSFTPVVYPSNVDVYPNPYVSRSKPKPEVRFVNLQTQARIRIYDLTGYQVAALEKNDSLPYASWDLRNRKNTPVASGIYIYVIETNGQNRKGKLAIVR